MQLNFITGQKIAVKKDLKDKITPGQSKMEKVVDPGSGPRGPLPEIGVHYLNLDFQGTPLVETF